MLKDLISDEEIEELREAHDRYFVGIISYPKIHLTSRDLDYFMIDDENVKGDITRHFIELLANILESSTEFAALIDVLEIIRFKYKYNEWTDQDEIENALKQYLRLNKIYEALYFGDKLEIEFDSFYENLLNYCKNDPINIECILLTALNNHLDLPAFVNYSFELEGRYTIGMKSTEWWERVTKNKFWERNKYFEGRKPHLNLPPPEILSRYCVISLDSSLANKAEEGTTPIDKDRFERIKTYLLLALDEDIGFSNSLVFEDSDIDTGAITWAEFSIDNLRQKALMTDKLYPKVGDYKQQKLSILKKIDQLFPEDNPMPRVEFALKLYMKAYESTDEDIKFLLYWTILESLLIVLPRNYKEKIPDEIKRKIGKVCRTYSSRFKEIEKFIDDLFTPRSELVHGNCEFDFNLIRENISEEIPEFNIMYLRNLTRFLILFTGSAIKALQENPHKYNPNGKAFLEHEQLLYLLDNSTKEGAAEKLNQICIEVKNYWGIHWKEFARPKD